VRRRAEAIVAGEGLALVFADGEVGAVASGSAEPAPAKPAKPRKSQGDQGSLL